MEPRIFHGEIEPCDIANALIANFSRGNLRAQQIGSGERIAVQIATNPIAKSGGDTALAVTIQKVADGISVQIGQQAWFGVAASLGTTALSALRNPISLLQRLDDLAQDFESLKLSDQVWETIGSVVRAAGASYELSERLRRIVCDYCNTANPVGEPSCIACGAPLGSVQPTTCLNCGFVIRNQETICPNCKRPLF